MQLYFQPGFGRRHRLIGARVDKPDHGLSKHPPLARYHDIVGVSRYRRYIADLRSFTAITQEMPCGRNVDALSILCGEQTRYWACSKQDMNTAYMDQVDYRCFLGNRMSNLARR